MKKIHLQCWVFVFVMTNGLHAGGYQKEFSLGFNLTSQKLLGDSYSGHFVFGGNPFSVRLNFAPNAFIESDLGYARLATRVAGRGLDTEMYNLGAKLGLRLYAYKKFNPLIYFGLGLINYSINKSTRFWDGYAAVGGGFEYLFSNRLALNFSGDYRYTSADGFDGAKLGRKKDAFINFSVGIFYYLKHQTPIQQNFDVSFSEEYLAVEEVTAEGNDLKNPEFASDEKQNQPNHVQPKRHTEIRKLLAEKVATLNLLLVKARVFDDQIRRLETALSVSQKKNYSNFRSANKRILHGIHKRYKTGLGYFEAGQFEDAIYTFKSLQRENPHHEVAKNSWFWLGECYFSIQDFEEAAKSYQAFLSEENPLYKREIAQYMLGLSLFKSSEIDQAKIELNLLLKMNPNTKFKKMAEQYLTRMPNHIPSSVD